MDRFEEFNSRHDTICITKTAIEVCGESRKVEPASKNKNARTDYYVMDAKRWLEQQKQKMQQAKQLTKDAPAPPSVSANEWAFALSFQEIRILLLFHQSESIFRQQSSVECIFEQSWSHHQYPPLQKNRRFGRKSEGAGGTSGWGWEGVELWLMTFPFLKFNLVGRKGRAQWGDRNAREAVGES